MPQIVFVIVVTLILGWLVGLGGCTESSTQWEHQRQSQEQCRDEAETKQARIACGD